jgi:hypothetical protein
MLSPVPAALIPAYAHEDDVLYVVNARLELTAVNSAWRSFACSNAPQVLGDRWNQNLLANLSGSERVRWEGIYGALLTGELTSHREDFICPSPVERRTFRLEIRRHVDASGRTEYLSHHAVRLTEPGAATVLGERLRHLEAGPREPPTDLKVLADARAPGLSTARYLAPLEDVGGDLLWERAHSALATDLVIADVMGHGVEAARFAAKLRGLLDSRCDEGSSPSQNVARLSAALFELSRGSGPLFATGLYLRVEPARNRLTVSSFGHVGPIFSIAGALEARASLPIGLLPMHAESWPEQTFDLRVCGRRFIAFTDGITEQFDASGEMLGLARLERSFRRALHAPLPSMVESIVADCEVFRGQALIKDDRALLAVEAGC